MQLASTLRAMLHSAACSPKLIPTVVCSGFLCVVHIPDWVLIHFRFVQYRCSL